MSRSDPAAADPVDGPVEIVTGDTVWRIDPGFLTSHWACIWGRGCPGIGSVPAPHLQRGCCSLGADLDGVDEARNLAAMAAMLGPERFEHHEEALRAGIFGDESRTTTRVVDGACIFLNRPGFSGGAGCALHLGALDHDESPIDWKPSVCWQLPIRVDWQVRPDGVEEANVRGWSRDDWGDDAASMGWWCVGAPEAEVAEVPVVESLAEELSAIMGHEVFVELRRRVG